MKHELLAASLATALLAAPFAAATAADTQPASGNRDAGSMSETVPSALGSENAPRVEDHSDMAPPETKAEVGTRLSGRDLLVTDLQDQTLYDLQNDEIGTIKGISSSGNGDGSAIVEIGGFFGFGAKLVAVPISHFFMAPNGRLVVNLSEEELEQLPAVVETDTPDPQDRS